MSMPPPTMDWKARARLQRSEARSSSQLMVISVSSLAWSSSSTIRPSGATTPNRICRQASRAAVPSPAEKRAGLMPTAARTSRLAVSWSWASGAGGLAPIREGCQSRWGAPVLPSPQPACVVSTRATCPFQFPDVRP